MHTHGNKMYAKSSQSYVRNRNYMLALNFQMALVKVG